MKQFCFHIRSLILILQHLYLLLHTFNLVSFLPLLCFSLILPISLAILFLVFSELKLLFVYYLKLVPAIFYFSTKWQSFKNYEKYFLFHLKSSFHSGDIQIFVFFPFFSTLSRFKRTSEYGIMMPWTGLHKLADVSFRINQNILNITSSNLVRLIQH